ncbi:MAG: thrombospondin type 3 repeat-containing protein [Saprospiraceae bacterium]
MNCAETVTYDSDMDGVTDENDNCSTLPTPARKMLTASGVGDVCEVVLDDDGDGVPNEDDLCANTPVGEGVNADGCSCSQVTVDDGDPCTLDECIDGVVTHTFQDADGDACDANDSCPGGDDNMDADADGIPDFCDACPNDPDNDIDGDGICGDLDNCSNTSNSNQADADGDGIGDECDPCPNDETNSCGQTYYEDQDDDGYSTFVTVFTNLPPNGYKLLEELLSTFLSFLDCNDTNPLEFPGCGTKMPTATTTPMRF